MGKIQISLCLLLAGVLPLAAQRYEAIPFGDFEHWTVRHIKESDILGGETKTLYVIGPDEVIEGNRIYDYSRTIWASSNADAPVTHAVLMLFSGSSGEFTGEPGNTLWLDNLRFEYER